MPFAHTKTIPKLINDSMKKSCRTNITIQCDICNKTIETIMGVWYDGWGVLSLQLHLTWHFAQKSHQLKNRRRYAEEVIHHQWD
jgi:hypothetical protein